MVWKNIYILVSRIIRDRISRTEDASLKKMLRQLEKRPNTTPAFPDKNDQIYFKIRELENKMENVSPSQVLQRFKRMQLITGIFFLKNVNSSGLRK